MARPTVAARLVALSAAAVLAGCACEPDEAVGRYCEVDVTGPELTTALQPGATVDADLAVLLDRLMVVGD